VNTNWILHAGFLSQFVPPFAALKARARLNAARKGALTWSVLLVTINLTALGFALSHRHNLWISYTLDPLLAAVGLWTLSQWQSHSVSRTTLQLLIPLYLLAVIVLTVTVEEMSSFSRITGPFTSLLLLGVSLYTVIGRSLEASAQLLWADWFWIGLAFALFYGSDAALGPLSRALLNDRPDLVLAAHKIKAVVAIVVSLALARGLLCPNPPMTSGGSSSPGSSPSPSS